MQKLQLKPIILLMTGGEFSYRPILQELTEEVNQAGLDPFEAYGRLYERQTSQNLQAETYLSSSITSGGHARDYSLQMSEIIARNTESARLLAEQLAIDGQIRAEAAVEPVFVGKTRWNQAEYMEFWLSVIGGYKLTNGFVARDIDNLRRKARSAFDTEEMDFDLMLSNKPAEKRAVEYFKMSMAFARLITTGNEAEPIGTVVRMIDPDNSLGAQTERAFARQIGSKVMNIGLVKPASTRDLSRVNHALALDTERLIKFGASVFDTSHNNVRLVLTEAAA